MKKVISLALALSALSFTAGAQSKIVNEFLHYNADKAIVSFDIETKNNSIPKNRKEVIKPFLYNGPDTLWLESVEVYGKNRFKRERQENVLQGNKTWKLEEGQFVKGEVYSYSDESPLKIWMTPANLGIKREIVGCACEEKQPQDQFITSQTLFFEPPVEPRRMISGFSTADVSKQWNLGEDLYEVIFKVSKIEIDPTVFNNEVTFKKILSAIDKIYGHNNFKVEKIEIAGYASPEGPVQFNKWLAENRAKALIDYIISQRPQYGFTQEHFSVVNGHENWAGLRKWTLGSNLSSEEKQQIIEIIDSDAGAARKDQLKALNWGTTYLKITNKGYPYLRSAVYLAIYYGSSQDEAVDKINLANKLLSDGQYEDALKTVEPYGDDFRAYNTMGVALMMNGEFEKALPYFEKAIAEGSEDAAKNKALVEAELKYEQQKRIEREEYMKRFQ